MDSFYDAPRRPPQPIPRASFPATPVVPEISVLCPSNTAKNMFTPYNQWKKDATSSQLNKENITSNFQNTSILKKQVRFESPVLRGNNEPFLNKTEPNPGKNHIENDSNPKLHDDIQTVPSFEQMYMANIPNRQLDLSVIDLPKRIIQNGVKNQYIESKAFQTECENAKVQEKEQPKTYKEFLETQKIDNNIIINDSVTDIYSYKSNTVKNDSCNQNIISSTHKIPMKSDIFRNKDSAVLNQNFCQSNRTDFKHEDPPEKNGKKEQKQDNFFQCVTEAISKRTIPVLYENQCNQSTKQISPENVTHQRPWFVPQNSDSGNLQNKLLHVVDTGSQAVPFTLNHNFASPKSCKSSSLNSQNKYECSTQTSNFENNAVGTRNDGDFSVKDLLKIIAQQSQQMVQQNEQILLLQKQVSELISTKRESEYPRQKSIQFGQKTQCCQQDQNYYVQPRHCCNQEQYCEQKQTFEPVLMNKNIENIQERCITSTQHENCNDLRKKLEATPKKNKHNMPNFSIGLTTSFEVSFRRPHCNTKQNDFLQKNKDYQGFEQSEPPKIQEITETNSTQSNDNYTTNNQQGFRTDNKETLVDDSMIFKEPIRVREPCPSPEPSIKINMNDFEDSESEDDTASPEIDASFYRNLMVQVNKILQKAQIETAEEVTYNFRGHNLKSNTLHKVKEATLKHLKRIGVEVHNSEENSQSSSFSDDIDCKSYNQDEISFAVKQLLMKYLPADHLAKIAHQERQSDNFAMLTPKEKIGAIKNRPDFSFATVQYMKKYNLIANNQKDSHQALKHNQSESPKVLDITKLKQQPKLL